MVRLFIVIFFFATLLQATALDDKIENFVGKKAYRTQKNLIRILFKNEKQFLRVDGTVDEIKVLKKLKTSGLLKLFYKKPQELDLSFYTKNNELIFMRVINESLSSMGYNYFITKRVLKNSDGFVWDIAISTEHIVDPLLLSKNLNERGCFLESIEKTDKNKWSYKVNSQNIRIDAIKIEANRTQKLNKPIKPYWIDVEGMKSISIASKLADRWFPSIVFYDAKLRIVKDYRQENSTNRLKLKIPQNSKYIKITDMYTLDNIKRGINIYLK